MVAKKKQKAKKFKIYNSLYGYDLYIHAGTDMQKTEKFFEKKFGVNYDPWDKLPPNALTYSTSGHKDHLIWFRASDPDAGDIAHEVFHSAFHVFRQSGIDTITKENEECFAYLMGWTMRGILLELYK